jgi:hypothetical protein
VSADNDLFDLQVRDGILDYRCRADVVGVDTVGDVAVHKNLARLAVAHGSLRNSRIGAAYPQHLGRLAFAELVEGIRVSFGGFSGVNSVSGNDAVYCV